MIDVSTSQLDQTDRKFGSVEVDGGGGVAGEGANSSSSPLDTTLDEELRRQVETEYAKNCHLPRLTKQLSVDSTFNFEDDAFVNNTGLRYNPWEKTILGKLTRIESFFIFFDF